MATGKIIAGGLLSGVGEGMVQQDQVRRKEAEQKRQEMLDRIRRQEDRQFQTERDQANREFQGGLLSRVDTDETGQRVGITRTGDVKELGFRGPAEADAGAGAGAGAGSAGIDNAQLNTLERISRNFWGSMNEHGEFMLPEGSQENYAETLERAEALVIAGMPAGQAANVAALSIAGPMDEKDARKQALKEAEDAGVDTPGWFGSGDTDWIDRRTQEIVRESREAERIYEQAVGRGGGQRQGSGQQGRSAPGATPPAAGAGPGQRGQDASGQYNSADDVKKAYQSNQITRDQALEILRSQFGFQ